MSNCKERDPRMLTPSQRHAEIVDLLARALVRLHQRGVLHKTPTDHQPLDLVGHMPLSVRQDDHRG